MGYGVHQSCLTGFRLSTSSQRMRMCGRWFQSGTEPWLRGKTFENTRLLSRQSMRKILQRAVCPVQSCPIIWCGAPPEHPKPNTPNPVRPNGKVLIHRRVTGTFKILMRSSILEEVNARRTFGLQVLHLGGFGIRNPKRRCEGTFP